MTNDEMQQMKTASVRISGFGFLWVLGYLGISSLNLIWR